MTAFISRDGQDPNGIRAEVYVQAGEGIVTAVTEKGRNAMVALKVFGPSGRELDHPVNGWLSLDDPIYPAVQAAQASGARITYRVESQRKSTIDRSIPIAELRPNMEVAKQNCRNIFAAIDDSPSSEAVTDPSEDPAASGRFKATATNAAPSPTPNNSAPVSAGPGANVEQALAALALARQGGLPPEAVGAAIALALAAGGTLAQIAHAGVDAAQEPTVTTVRNSHAAETVPYKTHNTDGRLNLGCFAVQAAVGAEKFAYELMNANALKVMEDYNAAVAAGTETGEPMTAPIPVAWEHAAGMGQIFLLMADQVQIGAYDGGRPDRNANSYTRARGYVYDAIRDRHPIPFGADKDKQEAWKAAIIHEGVTRFKNAASFALGHHEPAARAERTPESDSPAAGEAQETRSAPAETQGSTSNVTTLPATQAPAPAGDRPEVLLPGQEGYSPADQATRGRFADLALAAGFDPVPGSPVAAYLHSKFGVDRAAHAHGPAMGYLVDYYTSRAEGPDLFRSHVLAAAAELSMAG